MDEFDRSYETDLSLLYSCPVCHGHVLVADLTTPPSAPVREFVPGRKLYCPHCEMLVEPDVTTDEQRHQGAVARRDAASENRGRSRESGSNAGGSQRGDSSDEGATQWRVDPQDDLRNSWGDKPLRQSRAPRR